MTRFILSLCCLLAALNLSAQSVVHPKINQALDTPELTLRFRERKQNYSPGGDSERMTSRRRRLCSSCTSVI